MNPTRRARSGRHHLERLSVKGPHQPLGHLTSRGVAGAEKEDAFLHGADSMSRWRSNQPAHSGRSHIESAIHASTRTFGGGVPPALRMKIALRRITKIQKARLPAASRGRVTLR